MTAADLLFSPRSGQGKFGRLPVVGSVVMFSLLAVGIVGSMIMTERVWGTWDRVRATAVHPVELLIGKAIPGMGVLLIQQAAVFGFGIGVQGMTVASPGLLVLAILAWTLALLGFGAAVGVLARTLSELSAAFDIGGILLSGIGGAVVPLATMPEWIRAIAPVSPGYWGLARDARGTRWPHVGLTDGIAGAAGLCRRGGRDRHPADRLRRCPVGQDVTRPPAPPHARHADRGVQRHFRGNRL